MVAEAVKALRRLGKGERGLEDSVSYAVGHRYRIEILAALHEKPESTDGLSKIVAQPISTITHHVEELLKDGSIEVAWEKQIRANMAQNFYRVVKLPEFSDEEIAAMTREERQALAGLILQASTAEAMASLWAGKLSSDPRVWLAWNRIPLDRQGREDFADELERSWGRVKEIAAESTNRRAKSKEPGVMFIVTLFGYERSRSSAPPPLSSGDETGRASMVAEAVKALRRLGKGERGLEDSVSYAVGHRYRIEILAALHEKPESTDGLSKIVAQPISTITHHVEELLKDGSIEVAWEKQIRANMAQNFYRVVKLPEFSDEEIAAMTREERQALAGLILQASTAEAMASLWAGKLSSDPRVWLAWNRIPLDRQGREDFADELERSWGRVKEIAAESTNRRAKSKEPGVMFIVTLFGYERSRSSAPPPLSSGKY